MDEEDDQKCWALVAWDYWPSDLKAARGKDATGKEVRAKNGARRYHGVLGMVASNHLDICYETPEEKLKQYFWRQSYDIRDGSLSVSRGFCLPQPLL